tara:strand:+ start:1711 stop:2136 length:426 start_codon:yes stop_codon:yes gene_type:complete
MDKGMNIISKITNWVKAISSPGNLRSIYAKYSTPVFFLFGFYILYCLCLMQFIISKYKSAVNNKEAFLVVFKAAVGNAVIFSIGLAILSFCPQTKAASLLSSFLDEHFPSAIMPFIISLGCIIIAFVWAGLTKIISTNKDK